MGRADHEPTLEVIEAEPAVARARAMVAAGGAELLGALAAARNRAAERRGYPSFVALAERRLGCGPLPAPPVGLAPERLPAVPRSGRVEAAVAYLAGRGIPLGSVTIDLAEEVTVARCLGHASAVRVVARVPVSDYDWRALCHELGHAWDLGRGGPPRERDDGRVAAEAVAEWVADLADEVDFATQVLGLDHAAAVARTDRRRLQRQRYRHLQWARAALERALYQRPERARGLVATWAELTATAGVADPGPVPVDDSRLWQDPFAQQIYLAAESARAALARERGPAPGDQV